MLSFASVLQAVRRPLNLYFGQLSYLQTQLFISYYIIAIRHKFYNDGIVADFYYLTLVYLSATQWIGVLYVFQYALQIHRVLRFGYLSYFVRHSLFILKHQLAFIVSKVKSVSPIRHVDRRHLYLDSIKQSIAAKRIADLYLISSLDHVQYAACRWEILYIVLILIPCQRYFSRHLNAAFTAHVSCKYRKIALFYRLQRLELTCRSNHLYRPKLIRFDILRRESRVAHHSVRLFLSLRLKSPRSADWFVILIHRVKIPAHKQFAVWHSRLLWLVSQKLSVRILLLFYRSAAVVVVKSNLVLDYFHLDVYYDFMLHVS